MGICGWLVFGFFAGLIARAVMPGDQPMGFIKTTLLGIAGSFAGGVVSSMLFMRRDPWTLHPTGFIGAVVGSLILLLIGRALQRSA